MDEITQLLAQARAGRPEQLGMVFTALYPKLRRLAAARLAADDHTFTPTVLVHELYLRLSSGAIPSVTDRKHFFATAAQAMRWILVDHARKGMAGKRGCEMKVDAHFLEILEDRRYSEQIVALHQSLDDLDKLSTQRRLVVELRYFAGLQISEIAELLGCAERTVHREWERARAFLQVQMT
ncbi:ECF-type sigma factor [Microbulbifer pacificus]|uniref:ECF-type sigma factor n=1 Tax=Microbulbifer pacificus TaxID=407164 RepID=UPI000CF41804|nr:ECF-type sigma factor [Microbulbifer pacificus]